MSFVHLYREKDESNSSLLVRQLRQNPFYPFSSFLPSMCLTSLTSHLHLYDFTFVRHFINVADLSNIIMEKNINPILLFWSNHSSKTHFMLFLFSSFNVSYMFNITSSFMWPDFCTSLHKFCWPFEHHYGEKYKSNSSLLVKLLQQNPFHLFLLFFLHRVYKFNITSSFMWLNFCTSLLVKLLQQNPFHHVPLFFLQRVSQV